MPTLFYSILFSLDDAKKNLYSYLPFFQYYSLRATGTLKEEDSYALICDESSAAVLRESLGLYPRVQLLIAPKPATLLEGMALKYILHALTDISGKTCVYMDLDLLAIRPVKIDALDNKILALPEGPPTSNNYCGDSPLSLPVGFSAGFFIYRDSPAIRSFFKEMLKRIANCKKNFYALDQPHYNHLLAERRELIHPMNQTLVSFNGHNNKDTAGFVNLCGDPGDGPLHFQKVLQFFLSSFIRLQ